MYYHECKDYLTWEEFIAYLCVRFQDLGHDNVVGEFNKLQYVGTVLEYQEQFEQLKALMVMKNKQS